MNKRRCSTDRKSFLNRCLGKTARRFDNEIGFDSCFSPKLRENIDIKFSFSRHSVPATLWFAFVWVFVGLATISISPAYAQSTSQKSFSKFVAPYVKQELPKTIAGMQLTDVKAGVETFKATYTGGEPASTIAIVSRPLFLSPEKARGKLDKKVQAGKAQALTRNNHTLYLHIPSDMSNPARLIVLLDDRAKAISIMAKPDAIPDGTPSKAIKQQLLTVIDAIKLQQMAGAARIGLPISGHITVSGEIDLSTDLTLASPKLMHYSSAEGVVWSIRLLTDIKGLQVRLFNLPVEINPGQYKLGERPTYGEVVGNKDPFDQPAAMLFVDNDDSSDDIEFQTWEDGLTGTLTIDSINNHKMSGSFQFKTKLEQGSPLSVTVKGQFKNVPILNGQ